MMSKPTKQQDLEALQNRIIIAMSAGNTNELAQLVDAREMARSSKKSVAECEAAIRKLYADVASGTHPYVAEIVTA